MNTLRTLTVIVVLAAVAYGVYASLNNKPIADPPGMAPSDWNGAPTVELPGTPMPGTPVAEGSLTPYPSGPADPSGSAPPTAPLESSYVPNPPAPAVNAAMPSATSAPTSPYDTAAAPPATGVAPPLPGSTSPAPADMTNPTGAVPPANGLAAEGALLPRSPAATSPPPPTDAPGYAAQSPLDASPSPEAAAPTATPPSDDRYANHDATATAPSAEFDAALATAQAQLDAGQFAEAHLALSQWFGHPDLSSAQEAQLLDLLDRVAGTVIYSRQSLIEAPYEVQPGDTLEQIGQVYLVPAELLAKINGIRDPANLRAGERLKVVRGPFAAVVELDRRRMSLWTQGRYAGRFTIGVGQDANLTEGEFTVRSKMPDPTYYGPDQVIDAADPNNPLGERWIDLGNQVGIHGTNDPSVLGGSSPRGSISLSPRDIEDVYDILSVNSTVVIRR